MFKFALLNEFCKVKGMNPQGGGGGEKRSFHLDGVIAWNKDGVQAYLYMP